MIQSIFSGQRMKWLPLYQELKEMASEQLGTFEEEIKTKAIAWKHTSTFAEISAKVGCLVVGFASDTIHDEWEPVKVVQTSKNRVAHYFEVTDNHSFLLILERIKQSYELTKSMRPKRSKPSMKNFSTVDEYIAMYPEDIQQILEKVRTVIKAAAPDAVEKISWQMPTFYMKENLVHFAPQKTHLGFYPGADGVAAFQDKLGAYKTTKGAIQFPIDRPIPYELITEITKYRVQQALNR